MLMKIIPEIWTFPNLFYAVNIKIVVIGSLVDLKAFT